MKTKKSTSWENSSQWYGSLVAKMGHYYHQHVIMPGIKKIIPQEKECSFLDIGCGSGVLAAHFPHLKEYVGVDASPSLIDTAKSTVPKKNYQFLLHDATKPFLIEKKDFTHAFFVLSLQNMKNAALAIKNAAHHLAPNGTLIIVLNHPCFRIPKHSSWDIDYPNLIQMRKVHRYMSSQTISIQTHPGKTNSPTTLSFHEPLSGYSQALFEADLGIEQIIEWCSDKKSTGKHAQMEDESRDEIPLFLTLICRKWPR